MSLLDQFKKIKQLSDRNNQPASRRASPRQEKFVPSGNIRFTRTRRAIRQESVENLPDTTQDPNKNLGKPVIKINNFTGAQEIRVNPIVRRIKSIKLGRYFWLSLIILLVAGSVVALIKSDVFNIKSVKVSAYTGEKLEYLDVKKLEDEATKLMGVNYFVADTGSILNSYTGNFPYVESVYFEKYFPSSITFFIKERKPAYVASIDRKDCVVIDENAWILEHENSVADCEIQSKRYLATFIELSGHPIEYYESGRKFTQFIIDSAGKIEMSVLNNKYELVRIVVKEDIVTVELTGGRTVTLALKDDIDEQLLRFEIVVRELKTDFRDFKSLDLRYKRPIIKN